MEQYWAAHLSLVFRKMLPPPRIGDQPQIQRLQNMVFQPVGFHTLINL